jgi:hypothetical protein
VRKRIEIPVISNNTFILCDTEFEKYYQLREMLPYLGPDHQDVTAMRTICPLNNLNSLKSLKVLHHPYLFNNFTRTSGGATEFAQVEEVRTLLERN